MVLGRATTDPILQDSKNGNKFCRIPIAVNQRKRKSEKDIEEETFYYDVLLFGKMAENAVKQVKKADLLVAIGKPDIEAYVSTKNKKEARYSATLKAEIWQVLK